MSRETRTTCLPGTPLHYAGAEVVEFSPTDELGETIGVVMKNVQSAGAAS